MAAAGGWPCPAYLPEPDAAPYGGLILAGGGDMDPALFGQPDLGSRGVDPDRDRGELTLLDALGNEVPLADLHYRDTLPGGRCDIDPACAAFMEPVRRFWLRLALPDVWEEDEL